MPDRKVARRRADIPPEILTELNAGRLETATLVECLAVDMASLARAVLPELPEEKHRLIKDSAGLGITRRMELLGALLLVQAGVDGLAPWITHPSDTVRGWVCYALGLAPRLKLKDRLARLERLADDRHFGVREWAWLAVRSHIAANVGHAVKLLTPWARSPAANLRRFAVESTRPRGVWSAHIEQLKNNPSLAAPLLEPCRADPEVYVQDSVANWLNDAGKSQPGWVREVCARWLVESPHAATERICKLARRNLR